MRSFLAAAGLSVAPALVACATAKAQADCVGRDRRVVFAGLDWASDAF